MSNWKKRDSTVTLALKGPFSPHVFFRFLAIVDGYSLIGVGPQGAYQSTRKLHGSVQKEKKQAANGFRVTRSLLVSKTRSEPARLPLFASPRFAAGKSHTKSHISDQHTKTIWNPLLINRFRVQVPAGAPK